jgi:hypothetical protein
MIIAAVAFLAVGCATSNSTALQISGTPGMAFTVDYRAGALSGTVNTVTKSESPSKVLEVSGRQKEFTFDISKEDRTAHLTAEILEEGNSIFRAETVAGTQGIRISRTPRGWQQEAY